MFTGTYTAIITPFAGDGGLDEAGLRALVDRHNAIYATSDLPLDQRS